jgi:hypothetical protein
MTQHFSSGSEVLAQAIEEGKRKSDAARSAASGKSLQYFNWRPGDKKIIRFINDDYITEYFYDFILDRTGNTKNFMVDPSDRERLFRYINRQTGVGMRRNPKTMVLEEPQLPTPEAKGPGAPRKMAVCVAVLRTEVRREGKLVIEDYLYDRDDNGTAFPARYFGIVQQSISNFWHTLIVSCHARYGTLCDRDYEVTREGEGFDTKYSIIPLPEVPELTDTEMVKKFYGYGDPWDANDPHRYLKCPMTTHEWAEYFSGEERYRFWLDPAAAPAETESAPAPAAAPAGGGYTPSGIDEFHKDTTHNDEAQAMAPVQTTSSSATSFATLQDELLNAAKNKKNN